MKLPQLVFALLVFAISCTQESTQNETQTGPSIIGLWEVESVYMGEESMTPIARWVRFKEDGNQVSGNGWFRHSYGSWSLEDSLLSMVNENGLKDNAGAFRLSLNGEKEMSWQREEEGMVVQVQLQRIADIPGSPANQLLGAWLATEGNDFIYFGWDQRFRSGENDTRQAGIYHTHGHRLQLQMIYDDSQRDRSVSNYRFEGAQLILEQESGEKKFNRIDYLP